MSDIKTVAVVPTYKARATILTVVSKLGPYVDHVLLVDDGCPEESGKLVSREFDESEKITVLEREVNGGVGAAMKTGFDWALSNEFDIIIKVDADDQMDVEHIPGMIAALTKGEADFVKGNRFDSVQDIEKMPLTRVFGNAVLSLVSKVSTGLWTVNDPTNGFLAITRPALQAVQHKKLSDGFFFESDLLFRLGLSSCRVQEITMPSIYGDEKSNLRISRVIFSFPFLHLRNFLKRIVYAYFVREWSLGTLNLIGSSVMFVIALFLTIDALRVIESTGNPITAGQAVGISMTGILGFQLVLGFLSYDVQMQRRGKARFSLSSK